MSESDFRENYERFLVEANELEIVWNLQSDDGFAICESSQSEDVLIDRKSVV